MFASVGSALGVQGLSVYIPSLELVLVQICNVESLNFPFSSTGSLVKCLLSQVAPHVVCRTSKHDYAAHSLLGLFEKGPGRYVHCPW
jgi:hypothetical protein